MKIKEAIERIAIKTNHKTARKEAARELEAVGFWLLMFSIRGNYSKHLKKNWNA